ncbi:ABC transporter transmembrane domain-containing protein [Lyngbya aestuarii]|uniref:ABC transporter transmembrane domain-containing protein n=1 Tax=Lyngbya aestuarii TaxID=118322 RepID=UPI00403DEB4D
MTSLSPPPEADRNQRNSSQAAFRGRENDWRLFLRLLPYARRHRRLVWAALILLVPLSFANAIQPLLIGQAVSLIRQESTWSFLQDVSLQSGVSILGIMLLLTIVIRLVFGILSKFLEEKIGQQITAGIRDDLFDHVTSLAVRFFDKTPVGRLITRLTSDVEALGLVFSSGAIGIINDLFSMAVIAVFMFSLQWQLGLILVAMLFPVTGLIVYFQKQFRKANYKAREELSGLNSMLQENISGMNIVQLFNRQRFNAEMFRTVNQRYIDEVNYTIFHDSAVSATLEAVSLVAIAVVLWLGGLLILNDTLTFGVLSAFILYAQRLFNPLRQFAEKFTMFQAGFTALERISNLLNEPIEILDPEGLQVRSLQFGNAPELLTEETNGQPANPTQGEIRFEHVWFAYKEDDYVLKDLHFTIRPGEKVALVGPTGAGKSSIIRLLCRLYEPTQGRILVDGIDVRDLPQAQLRRYMGIILQDGFLFSGDVKGNIALGEDYSLEEIQAAAQATNVGSFIEQLPEGYDTQLRERGTNLSGGQKQLLAFARAAIRNPVLLVLDEATASLDVGTEALIQQSLERLLQERTAIIIAHRLSTIRNANRILVLKRGQLVESGTHEELLQENGLYASLYKLQMLGS